MYTFLFNSLKKLKKKNSIVEMNDCVEFENSGFLLFAIWCLGGLARFICDNIDRSIYENLRTRYEDSFHCTVTGYFDLELSIIEVLY
jgi:hypothetical protein